MLLRETKSEESLMNLYEEIYREEDVLPLRNTPGEPVEP